MINLVLANDHSIVRNGLIKLLENVKDIKILKECVNGLEVMEFVETTDDIDIVIADLDMPEMNGLELTIALSHFNPNIKVIILSIHDDFKCVFESLKAGALGYLLISTDKEELAFAINRVQQRLRYVFSEMISNLLQTGPNSISYDQTPTNLENFSDRELEVLKLIADGLTNVEISDKLFLSKRTIEGHRQSLLQKTGSNNTASLIKYAVKGRLII